MSSMPRMHVVVDAHRALEALAAVHDAVADASISRAVPITGPDSFDASHATMYSTAARGRAGAPCRFTVGRRGRGA